MWKFSRGQHLYQLGTMLDVKLQTLGNVRRAKRGISLGLEVDVAITLFDRYPDTASLFVGHTSTQ
jgi:2-keto-4-pentenoate hydratase